MSSNEVDLDHSSGHDRVRHRALVPHATAACL